MKKTTTKNTATTAAQKATAVAPAFPDWLYETPETLEYEYVDMSFTSGSAIPTNAFARLRTSLAASAFTVPPTA